MNNPYIAMAGIWIGVGLCSFNISGENTATVAFLAVFATLIASRK